MTITRSYYVADGTLSDTTYRVGAGGELDLAAQSELVQSLVRAESSGAETLYLDLRNVSFIDSTAIKAIAVAGREILARGGRVKMSVGNQNVLRIFQITGLDRFFDIRLELAVEEAVL